MNRKKLDEAILKAIEILKWQNKPVTAANILEVPETKLRPHQIYTSKHIDQIEIRARSAKKRTASISNVDLSAPKNDAQSLQAPTPAIEERSTVIKPVAINTKEFFACNLSRGSLRLEFPYIESMSRKDKLIVRSQLQVIIALLSTNG